MTEDRQPWEDEVNEILRSGKDPVNEGTDKITNRDISPLANDLGITPEEVGKSEKLVQLYNNSRGLRQPGDRRIYVAAGDWKGEFDIPKLLRGDYDYVPVGGYKTGHILGKQNYENDLEVAIEYGPKQLEMLWDVGQLSVIGYLAGLGDGILETDSGDAVKHALSAYQVSGVLNTTHVKRKLQKYGERGPAYRSRLVDGMRQLGLV